VTTNPWGPDGKGRRERTGGRFRDRAGAPPLVQPPAPQEPAEASYPGDVGARHAPDGLMDELAAGLTPEAETLVVGMPADPALRLRWFGERRRIGSGSVKWARELYPWLYAEVSRALLAGASRLDIARDLGMHPTSADKLVKRAWEWTRSRHVEADPRDVYAQIQEELRILSQASMVGLATNRPRPGEKTDHSLEFTRYGLSLLRAHQMKMKVMEKFGVLATIAGGQHSDRERQMDRIREEFDEAFLALGAPLIERQAEAVDDDSDP
jgi:hypothetical protein